MHTAFDFKKSDFAISRNGEPIDRDELLEWDVRDRLGVLIDRPVGALGAGLLIFLTISAFYDCPQRRRRNTPIYPDVFLFHVGGPWGVFTMFDFWPDHKEILVVADPCEVLRVINNRGITHLVLPERPREVTKHRYKEREACIDRLKKCFVYSPDGAVQEGAIKIETGKEAIFKSYAAVLDMEAYLEARAAESSIPKRLLAASTAEERRISGEYVKSRLGEVSKNDPHWVAASARLASARTCGRMAETFREVQVQEALELFG
jgi:hypothetical protein